VIENDEDLAELKARIARPVEAAARLRRGLPLLEEPPVEEPEPVVELEAAAGAAVVLELPAPKPSPPPQRGVNLFELERAVRACPDPAVAEELRFYVLYLRHHAGASGALPPSLVPLVDSVFGPVLAAQQQCGQAA